jgi:hypothetical protein
MKAAIAAGQRAAGANPVIASHSRSKNGVASLAYGEAIQPRTTGAQTKMRHMARTHTGLLRRCAPRNDG